MFSKPEVIIDYIPMLSIYEYNVNECCIIINKNFGYIFTGSLEIKPGQGCLSLRTPISSGIGSFNDGYVLLFTNGYGKLLIMNFHTHFIIS